MVIIINRLVYIYFDNFESQEFRAAQALGDQVFEVNKKARNLLYRIPMYCLVDYKVNKFVSDYP